MAIIYLCACVILCSFGSDLYFQFTFQLKNDWNWKCIRSHNKAQATTLKKKRAKQTQKLSEKKSKHKTEQKYQQ